MLSQTNPNRQLPERDIGQVVNRILETIQFNSIPANNNTLVIRHSGLSQGIMSSIPTSKSIEVCLTCIIFSRKTSSGMSWNLPVIIPDATLRGGESCKEPA